MMCLFISIILVHKERDRAAAPFSPRLKESAMKLEKPVHLEMRRHRHLA